jgi:hypothetical protein
MTISPDDFLMGGGGGVPSFSFGPLGSPPGATVTGKILKLETSQQTDYNTRAPLTWANGDPKMQLEVTLQTTLRDPSIEDDDGQRRVFVKGKGLTDATRDAVLAVGAKGLEIGGTITFTYSHDTKPPSGGNAYREYTVVYERPNASGAFLGTEPTAPAAASANGGSADEAPLQAALANLSPEVKAALLAQAGKAG